MMTKVLRIKYTTPATPAGPSRVVEYDTPLMGDLCARVQVVDENDLVLYQLPAGMFAKLEFRQTEIDLSASGLNSSQG